MSIEQSVPVVAAIGVKGTQRIDLSSYISIETSTIQFGGTKVIVNIIEDSFKDLGPNIVCNIIDYSISSEEEEKRKSEVEEKK